MIKLEIIIECASSKECIVIYRDGSETIALNTTTGEKAVAKCSPDDTYNFNTGARLAFDRLVKPPVNEVREVKRVANAGEYVKVVNAANVPITNGKPDYKNGDILKIIGKFGCLAVYDIGVSNNGLERGLGVNEYVVLENYQPPKKEKPAFKPYLTLGGKVFGYIGDPTPLKDAIGRELKIGDIVELYDKERSYVNECVVCYDAEEKKAYVMGILSSCKENGTIRDGWKIILKRKYEEVANGENVRGFKYIKEEV